jgi:DivIVA domain-containing protein
MAGSLFFRIAAWILIACGALLFLRLMVRLSRGRSSLTKPGARREAWSELRTSFTIVAFGLWVLAELGRRFHAFWGPALNLVWLVLILWEPVILQAASWIRTRRTGKPSGEIGGAAAAGMPGSAPDEQAAAAAAPPSVRYARAAELAEWIDRKRFSTTRLRPGYDEEEVDALLDDIRDTFLGSRQTPVTPDEVVSTRFSRTRVRPGYVDTEVDAFLRELQVKLTTDLLG